MVDHKFTFKTDPEHTLSSRKFSIADMMQFSSTVGVFCHVMSFLKFLDRVPFIDIRRRDFYRERECESNKERRETDGVLFCGGLLWIISVTRIKRLTD